MAYFANGTEGLELDYQCINCLLGEQPCPIFQVQMEHNYSQIGNPEAVSIMNKLVNEEGICQMRNLINKYIK